MSHQKSDITAQSTTAMQIFAAALRSILPEFSFASLYRMLFKCLWIIPLYEKFVTDNKSLERWYLSVASVFAPVSCENATESNNTPNFDDFFIFSYILWAFFPGVKSTGVAMFTQYRVAVTDSGDDAMNN